MNISINGSHIVLFILIVSRIAGIFTIAPVLGERTIPSQLKIGISCLIALTVFPSLVASPNIPTVGEPLSLIVVVKETIVGLAIGYMARLLFFGLQLGAYLVDFQMGLGMAGVFDPSIGSQSSLVGILTNWVAMILFLAINGHHRLIAVLVESFETIPLGGMAITSKIGRAHV
jgi:flagellar biosynthetic protein FliR